VEHPEWAGRSARPLIEGAAAGDGPAARDHVVTGWGNMASVRDRDWNYVVPFEDPHGAERLYDLRADPLEQRDVAAGNPEVLRLMRRRLEALLGQELGTPLPDGPLDDTVAPCRTYYGARPATRQEQASGFV
jgi:arylsulfatase A-like enzyme